MSDGAAENRRMRLDVHLHLAGEDRAYLAGLLLGVESRRGSVAQFPARSWRCGGVPVEGWRHLYQGILCRGPGGGCGGSELSGRRRGECRAGHRNRSRIGAKPATGC